MKARLWVALALMVASTVTPGAGRVVAQQDEGPVLRPKKPTAKPVATLLVMCDLACNWKLDGEAKGRIESGGSVKVRVEIGEHMVVAVTDDGLDTVQELPEVKAAGQKVVNLQLRPVREARLKVDQEGREKAAREQEREQRAREEAKSTWTDPATGLLWTKHDSGNNIDLTWQQAVNYCRNLKLAGHADWRLPTIDELGGISDSTQSQHVRGNLQLSGAEWSSSTTWDGQAWYLLFPSSTQGSCEKDFSFRNRALCVPSSRE